MNLRIAVACVLLFPFWVHADPIQGTFCVVNLNSGAGVFLCHDNDLGKITVPELYAKGWRIVQVVLRPDLPSGSIVYIEQQR